MHRELGSCSVEVDGPVATIAIVLTGTGDEFYVLPDRDFFSDPAKWARRADPAGAWRTFTGILRVHHLMVEIEKPIIAKVNGDAEAFGCSLVLASDLIVAADDAVLVDLHLGMGEHAHGPPFGIVAGDGGAPLAPLYMSPTKAKEFLMLSPALTGRGLADAGIANAAVPRSDLDAVVADYAERLLRRSAFALAWAKRSVNRQVAQALNASLDASVAYEMVNFLQLARLGHDPKALDEGRG